MAISKVERLMNLVICLLATRQFITADRIRTLVAGYDSCASDDAFNRMFERDKGELRDLGVPLETGKPSAFSTIDGYRINRADYELPEISLARDEAAAVAVAVRLWQSPELTAAAQSAVLKLRAAGVQVESDATPAAVTAVPARSRGSEPALGRLLTAIDSRRAVTFSHRSSPTLNPTLRRVEPWGVVTHAGRWYLVGHDRDRDETRTFRISRIDDDVTILNKGRDKDVHIVKPGDVDLQQIVEHATATAQVSGTASVWVADGRAQEIRRMGVESERSILGGRVGTVVSVSVRSWDWIARAITGHGPDAVVLAPQELRDEVIARLTAAARTEGEP